MNKITSRFFKESEFNKCTPYCSLQNMEQSFIDRLDAMRLITGVPMILTSAYRSFDWEISKGRTGTGDHPQGKGADIQCTTTGQRHRFLNAAIRAGFSRIGIGKNFIHVGSGNNLPEKVVWLY